MNETERHEVSRVLALEEVERFIFEILVGLWIHIQCFPRPRAEMAKGMSRVGCCSFNLKRKKHKESSKTFLICLAHLVQPPDVTELVLLVFALDDLHLVLDGLLVEHGAHQVRDKP